VAQGVGPGTIKKKKKAVLQTNKQKTTKRSWQGGSSGGMHA
jgi:hypothetical protein